MAKTLVALAVFTLLVAAVRTPAAASITSASVSGPSFSGPCPTTMVFKGTVTGTPGTTFKLSFNRFINGVQQIAAKGNLYALEFQGRRYDAGNKLEFLQATFDLALERDDLGPPLRAYLEAKLRIPAAP